MHPGLMMMPGGGGAGAPVPSGGAGAGGAGAMAGADILSDTMNEGEAVNTESSGGAEPLPGDEPFDDTNAGADGFSNPSTDFDTAAGQGESEWATFEEPDHGFDDSFSDESAWSAQDDSWDGDTGGDEGGASGGLFGLIKDIFFDQD